MNDIEESIELVGLNTYNEPEKERSVRQPLYSSVKSNRQPSINAAKRNWSKVKRAMIERSDTQMSFSDKWVNLTRSMSHNVGEFLGVTPENDTRSRDPSSEKWRARSRRLHNNSFIFNRGIIKNNQHSAIISDPTPGSGFSSAMPSLEIEKATVPQSFPLDKWSHKLSPHPVDPFSMHSRQFSTMSTTSSKRIQRLQSCKSQLSKDSILKMAVNRFAEKRILPKRSFTQAAKMATIACLPEETIEEDFFKECIPTSPFPQLKLLQIPPISYSAFNSLNSYDAIDSSDYDFLPVHNIDITSKIGDQKDIVSNFKIHENIITPNITKGKCQRKSKRKFGIGFVGQLFGNEYKVTPMSDTNIECTTDFTDYRPYFTYWVTFVQIVIYIFTVSVYGISYIGFGRTIVEGEVRRNNLAIEIVHYFEQDNMWIGPRQADLIHLGARYSPCMRRDLNVLENIEKDRIQEKLSGCCFFNDGSGCVQIMEGKCPRTLANWINATVCGQDPRYCQNSILPAALWSKEDITLWPVCKDKLRRVKTKNMPSHVSCELIGRPCCIGIHGQCIITTQDHCDFLRGYFHPELTLCSQIPSCLSEVCGMIPFYDPSYPNQFYRLWTSLFLHAGLIQLCITILFQFFIMKDVEKLLGWFRVAIIYITSGVIGSLASAIFLPYHIEAGPSGSQFAIISCLVVEVLNSWSLLDQPSCALIKLLLLILILFIAGLFPWIDNWAHLFGLAIGFLLSIILMPYVDPSKDNDIKALVNNDNSNINSNISPNISPDMIERGGGDAIISGLGNDYIMKKSCRKRLCMHKRLLLVIICFIVTFSLLALLIVLFYVHPIYSCDLCHYINCIPFTTDFCRSVEIKVQFIEEY